MKILKARKARTRKRDKCTWGTQGTKEGEAPNLAHSDNYYLPQVFINKHRNFVNFENDLFVENILGAPSEVPIFVMTKYRFSILLSSVMDKTCLYWEKLMWKLQLSLDFLLLNYYISGLRSKKRNINFS